DQDVEGEADAQQVLLRDRRQPADSHHTGLTITSHRDCSYPGRRAVRKVRRPSTTTAIRRTTHTAPSSSHRREPPPAASLVAWLNTGFGSAAPAVASMAGTARTTSRARATSYRGVPASGSPRSSVYGPAGAVTKRAGTVTRAAAPRRGRGAPAPSSTCSPSAAARAAGSGVTSPP